MALIVRGVPIMQPLYAMAITRAVDSCRKEFNKAIAQWEHLSYAVQSFFKYKKLTVITCNGFGPISNMPGSSCIMGTISCENKLHRTVGTLIFNVFKRSSTIYTSFSIFKPLFSDRIIV